MFFVLIAYTVMWAVTLCKEIDPTIEGKTVHALLIPTLNYGLMTLTSTNLQAAIEKLASNIQPQNHIRIFSIYLKV